MPRIRIERQTVYPHEATISIRVSDLNYGAHLGYDRVLTLAHEIRVRLFSSWGVTELNLGDARTGIVASDAGANYVGEGFAGDRLSVGTRALEIGPVTFRLAHRFIHAGTGAPLAFAEIGFVAFDYQRRAPGRLPEAFIARLRGIAGE